MTFIATTSTVGQLFMKLLELEMRATGTLRTNHKGTPKDVLSVKTFQKAKGAAWGLGYYIREEDSPIVYCCWHDNSIVTTISTCFPVTLYTPSNEMARINPLAFMMNTSRIPVPVIIEKYNRYMGAGDNSDQLLQYHSSLRRTIRYWKTLLITCLML